MQEAGKAVFEIEQADTALVTESGTPWGGGTWTDAARRMAIYKSCFEQLSERLKLAD
jgi:hypothetical protein